MTAAVSVPERTVIDTIRTLSMDAVQRANSGHPGTPMALAPVAHTLWSRFLRFDPEAPGWPCRDRFVLSCGHASMLLYAILHLAGVKSEDSCDGDGERRLAVSLEDLRSFRQLHSPCAGHPEFGEAAGIETTTGPLGQGIATSVGMAIAAKWTEAHFGRPGFESLFGNRVFALCSDGDLMEGIGGEAASLAGHLQLDNLCWIYDDNRITIEGDTDLTFSEDVARRFAGLGWRVQSVEDANDTASLAQALEIFDHETHRPTLIIVRSVIAWGAPHKANTHGAHGSPLGETEVRLTKEAYGWPPGETFRIPTEAVESFRQAFRQRGQDHHRLWREAYADYSREHPDLAQAYETMLRAELPHDWESALPQFRAGESVATRVSSGKVLNAIAARIPWLVGGSADLAPSTKTLLEGDGGGSFSATTRQGRNLHFGIREHAMAAAGNGMSLSRLRPYVATFFVFCDYLKPALRLSALMHQPVIYIFTHDSIGLGEDGPTHQPIEHLAACRAIPNTVVLRPADAHEVTESYRVALRERRSPVLLVLTRQDVPTLCRESYASAQGVARGAYVLAEAKDGRPEVILIGTGSELHVALDAHARLVADGVAARLVSMPSWELFERQDQAYRDHVLPPHVPRRVAVEAGVEFGWQKYLGPHGRFIGMSSFGASAPFETLYEHFGITADRVYEAAQGLLASSLPS